MYRIMFVDIEVLQEEGKFPYPKEAERPVICLTVYDNYMKKFITLIQKDNLEPHVEDKDKNWNVVYLNNERDLFLMFLKIYKTIDPDIVTAWNISFDIPYLIQRASKKGYFDPKELSPIGRVEIDWENNDVIIGGVQVLDMLTAYRKIKHQPSYSLKYIAKAEGLAEKTEEAEDIPWLYENNLDRLVFYNKRDDEIIVQLEEKFGIIQQFIDMVNYAGVNDINAPLMFSVLLDTLALRIAKKEGVVLPNKKSKRHKSYKGAIVFEPIGSIHKNVIILDMNRYYPSIILTLNISPETFGKNTDKLGIVPKMVIYLYKQRKKYEQLMEQYDPGSPEYQNYARKRQVVKDLLNSVYGYLGYRKSRFFNIEMAETVTATARKGLLFIKDIVENNMGYKIIYGDTDSIFIKVPGEYNIQELVNIGKEIEDTINKELEKFAYEELKAKQNYLSVGFEKIYSPVLFIPGVKKRYSARVIYEKGKETDYVLVKGFDTIRTDSPEVLREVQGKIIEMILYGKSREEILEFVREIYNNLKKGKYSPNELGIPKGIQKPLEAYGGYKNGRVIPIPFHIRAAIWSNKYLGTNFGEGNKVKVLYVKKVHGYPSTDVIAFTDDTKLPELEIDTEKYINWLKSKVEDFLRILDISWYEIEGGKNLWDLLKKN